MSVEDTVQVEVIIDPAYRFAPGAAVWVLRKQQDSVDLYLSPTVGVRPISDGESVVNHPPTLIVEPHILCAFVSALLDEMERVGLRLVPASDNAAIQAHLNDLRELLGLDKGATRHITVAPKKEIA